MPIDDISSLIPPIKIHPFPIIENLDRNKSLTSPAHATVRKAYLECPICKGLDDFYNCEQNSHYRVIHCPGNQAPEHEHRDLLGNTHKHTVVCAGLNVPHFHVQCVCCDIVFFVSLPKEA